MCDNGTTASQDGGSSFTANVGRNARYNQKNAKIGEADFADDIKCGAVLSTVPENLERHLQLNARRPKRFDEVLRVVHWQDRDTERT